MENLFLDVEFESGMCLLMDTFTTCIEKERYGFIHEKGDKFSVHFCFTGLKYGVKRKNEDDDCRVSKKIKKLNVSLENLVLISEDNTKVIESTENADEVREGAVAIKIEPDSNADCSSGVLKRTGAIDKLEEIAAKKPRRKSFKRNYKQ